MSNKLCKCGKVGEISCPHDERCGNPMSNDNTLPEELQKEIADFAANIIKRDEYKDAPLRFIEGMLWGIDAGATEYAPYKLMYEQAERLLDKFMARHEAGLLPDIFIYNEIKSFLDGTK